MQMAIIFKTVIFAVSSGIYSFATIKIKMISTWVGIFQLCHHRNNVVDYDCSFYKLMTLQNAEFNKFCITKYLHHLQFLASLKTFPIMDFTIQICRSFNKTLLV